MLVPKPVVCGDQHAQELGSSLPPPQRLLEMMCLRARSDFGLLVSEPLSVRGGTGARGSCKAARTFEGHRAAVGSPESDGNSRKERGVAGLRGARCWDASGCAASSDCLPETFWHWSDRSMCEEKMGYP